MGTPKRLFFDVETSPNIGFFWSAGYRQTIDYHNIIKERSIICICYKWEGERGVSALTWDAKQDDKKMLCEFIRVLKTADEIVGHNGDKFDMAWIRTRCLFHRLEMFPDYKTIDTLKAARSKFRFNSNRLNYIANYLGIGNKNKVDFDLWKRIVMHNDEPAMKKMVAYCKQDVKLLERVYQELGKHMEPKVHHGVLAGHDRGSCPNCGSIRLYKKMYRTTKTGLLRIVYRCYDCTRHVTKAPPKGGE